VSKYECSNADCTVAVTEKCVLSHVPIEACPNVRVVGAKTTEDKLSQTSPALPTTTVHHGNELGWQQTSALLAAQYGHLVGVLGATGTGKTCLLSSLYLLASCGDLRPSFLFAGSTTLPGFESRLRLLRKWSGSHLPEQIVDHTILSDDRQPGLLHLALLQTTPIRIRRELLFTDLPGEWTTDLVKRADKAERLRFLRRADALLITLPAPHLIESRNSQILFGRMLLQRLRDEVGVDLTSPVVLTITRCDKTGATVPPATYQLVEAAHQLGFLNVSHLPVAAFSGRSDVPSGTGLASLLDTLFQARAQPLPEAVSALDDSRMFARYRFPQDARP